MPQEIFDDRADARQLPLVHDGLPLLGADATAYAMRAAIDGLDPHRGQVLDALRSLAPNQVAVLGNLSDEVPALLDVLGASYRWLASEDLPGSDATVAFIGCPHRHTRLDEEDVWRFLGRGGVLVSSCRAALLPGIAGLLDFDRPRGPRRARVATFEDGSDQDGVLHPAVALDGGHVPLARSLDHDPDVAVLARDVLDDRPVIVAARRGQGLMVHSVAHWWQENSRVMTELEQRPLSRVRDLAPVGNSYGSLTWGQFRAARVMVDALLDAIAIGLPQSMLDGRVLGVDA